MIPFKQKNNSILKNTAVLIILLSLSNTCFSYLQDFRRTTEDSRRFVDDQRRQLISKDGSRRSITPLQREVVEPSSYIRDVRADSRQSRIDARDIRTDFREIRTELRNIRNTHRSQDTRDTREQDTNGNQRGFSVADRVERSRRSQSQFRDFNNNVKNEEPSRNGRDNARVQNHSQQRLQRQLPNRRVQDSPNERREFNSIRQHERQIREKSQEGNEHGQIRDRRLDRISEVQKESRDSRNVRERSDDRRTASRYDDRRLERTLSNQREVQENARQLRDVERRFNSKTTSRVGDQYSELQDRRDSREDSRSFRDVRTRSTYRRSANRGGDHRVESSVLQHADRSRERINDVANRQNDRQKESLPTSRREDRRTERTTLERRDDVQELSRRVLGTSNILSRRGLARQDRRDSQNIREWSRTLRQSPEPADNRRRMAMEHQERKTEIRKSSETTSEFRGERREDPTNERLSRGADRQIDISRRSRLLVERHEISRKNNRQQADRRREVSENVRDRREVGEQRDDIRNTQRMVRDREDFERRVRLADDRRNLRDTEVRNIKDTLRRHREDSQRQITKAEALRNVEFIPNYKENSSILINTLQAVIIVALFGQMFVNTSKNKYGFSSWQTIFGKEKIY